MCTVTLVPRPDGGFRLGINRDESRHRPPADPPRVDRFAGRRAILPIDPVGGGTWAAVNDAGLAMTLLNVNDRAASPPSRTRSRGAIIPYLLHCGRAAEAAEAAARLDATRFAPFHLIMVDARDVFELRGEMSACASPTPATLGDARLFCSSGLGDDVADRPRRRLWHWITQARATSEMLNVQERFHRHHWPDRPELSVCMRRPDARTVSHTVIDAAPGLIAMRYTPGPPDAPEGEVTRIQLASAPSTEGR